MSPRLIPPDGTEPAPALTGSDFARVLAILADRNQMPPLPAPAEANAQLIPLVVVDTGEVFAAGPHLKPQFGRAAPALRRRDPTFQLVASQPVTLDLGDGSAARTVAPGETATAQYPQQPEALLGITGDARTARCRTPINDAPAPAPAQVTTLPGATISELPAPGHPSTRCPLVVVEGFPGGHGFLFSYDLLSQHGLLQALQGAGHDLVVVGLDDGTLPLPDNVPAVAAALAEIGQRTPLPITLLGWSMGGLLARLAVSRLEADGVEHRIETLITWDSPHRGSTTQLGVQWFVEQLASEHPALELERRLLHSPANRQMDLLCVGPTGTAAPDPLRGELESLLRDWPQRPRRLLVSSGRSDGQVSLPPGQVLVHWHQGPHDEICLRTMGGGEPIATGSLGGRQLPPLQLDGQLAWDGMPGARDPYPAQAAIMIGDLAGGHVTPPHPSPTCIVPTVSALDLDGAPDAPVPSDPELIAAAADQPHLVIEPEQAVRLQAALGAPFDPDRFDPHDPGFLADPAPTYARFREFAPIHRVAQFDSLWCFKAADCRAILQDTDTWLKHPPTVPVPPPGPMTAMATLPPGLFSSDPPAHTQLRQAVEVPLQQALGRVPALVAQRAEELLAPLRATGRVELVQDYALPLPAAVLFDLLGIDSEPVLRMTLIAWQQAVTTAHDPTVAPMQRLQGVTAGMALRTLFTGLIDRHRRTPTPGLLGDVCDAFAAAERSDAELEATLCDLLIAGYLSTTFLIATGLWRLLSQPEALGRLRAQPDSITAVVDELLRLDGPVQVIDRFASRPTTLGGQQVAAGTKATAVVGAANWDPDTFPAPEKLRSGRSIDSLAFGAGIHRCVGAPLARAVAPAALRALLESSDDIELNGIPQWQTDPYLRAVTSLPLRISFNADAT